MDIYLIRHTRPDIGRGVCYGQLDVALPSSCTDDFGGVLAKLPEVDAVWTSPLARCRLLAERIAAPSIELSIDPRLSELNFGNWEGRPWSEIDRAESDPWADNYWNVAPPEGETYCELHRRVAAALKSLTMQPARSVAVVAHAGPIRAALAQCMGSRHRELRMFELDHGGVTLLGWSGRRWRIEYINR